MMFKVSVQEVDNGFIVEQGGYENTVLVFEEDSSYGKLAALRNALNAVVNQLGHSGSRHDAKRISVQLVPGDKHPSYDEQPCEFCGRS